MSTLQYRHLRHLGIKFSEPVLRQMATVGGFPKPMPNGGWNHADITAWIDRHLKPRPVADFRRA
jgi:predicted DNA-binding transcriptional regulator AlpA